MEDHESALFGLELITKKNLSPQEVDILKLFAFENPDEAAFQIDSCCPPLAQQKEASSYLWALWEVMVDVVRSPDVTSEIHKHLVCILQGLVLIAKGELVVWNAKRRVWGDLPLFPQCMDAYLDSPMEEMEEFTPESAQMWLNLSSFAARCMGAGVLGPYMQVINALRAALEEELGIESDLTRAECKIQVACEWIAHGAKPLVWWARENIGYSEVAEDSTQYFPGGPLYRGPPTVCLQRWGFWQTQFEELGKVTGLRDEVRKAALEAAETMNVIERCVANTL